MVWTIESVHQVNLSFTAEIPATQGNLSKLYLLDLADNNYTGSLPVSTMKEPGFESLKKTKHFHLDRNHLSRTIPHNQFSTHMVLRYVLLDRHQFRGTIPCTIGLVQILEVM